MFIVETDYANYSRCRVDYSEDFNEYDEFADGYIVLDEDEFEYYLEYIVDF